MSTPSYSEARPGRRIPVGRYLLAIPIAIVGFLVLAIIEENEVFFPPERPGPPQQDVKVPIERVVRDLAKAIEAGYAGAPAPATNVSPDLAAEIAAELEFARRRGDPPLRLARFEVLRVDPAGEGEYSVTTDETWTSAPGETSRLRWRYRVVANSPARVEEMNPIIPKAGDGRR